MRNWVLISEGAGVRCKVGGKLWFMKSSTWASQVLPLIRFQSIFEAAWKQKINRKLDVRWRDVIWGCVNIFCVRSDLSSVKGATLGQTAIAHLTLVLPWRARHGRLVLLKISRNADFHAPPNHYLSRLSFTLKQFMSVACYSHDLLLAFPSSHI